MAHVEQEETAGILKLTKMPIIAGQGIFPQQRRSFLTRAPKNEEIDSGGKQPIHPIPSFNLSEEITDNTFQAIQTSATQLSGMEKTFTIDKDAQFLIIFSCELAYLSETTFSSSATIRIRRTVRGATSTIDTKTFNWNMATDTDLEEIGSGKEGSEPVFSCSMFGITNLKEGENKIFVDAYKDSDNRHGVKRKRLIIIQLS